MANDIDTITYVVKQAIESDATRRRVLTETRTNDIKKIDEAITAALPALHLICGPDLSHVYRLINPRSTDASWGVGIDNQGKLFALPPDSQEDGAAYMSAVPTCTKDIAQRLGPGCSQAVIDALVSVLRRMT